ncbi:alpha/beta hydrolase [Pseudomaricurvus alkylphenolicus]|uniref:alpha/beta fold hydrolase n=1 Tax=Pseudomaricurvus alkylphenolicus TaxID=1306991 RepID=UPI0014228377|nr:alpha/beta hydrolase [Pseudomaricurvus alkylphenolicus]NIB44101.1 alpha/beta hydrolase [Pseudomaricurvus alkylphenolicus]
MPTTTIAMIHGGQHTSHCWTPTLHAIRQFKGDFHPLAVDLPGRKTQSGDLAFLTVEQAVNSVCRQILDTEPEHVILVGHSMAGIVLPGVAVKLGSTLVRRVVFLASCVPPEGMSIVDTLRPPISWVTRWLMRNKNVTKPMPAPVAKWLFTNGATAEQHQIMLDSLCDESANLARQPVERRGFRSFTRQWILTCRDRSLRPAQQRRFIANLGGVDSLVEIDACHNAMITHPNTLARILVDEGGGFQESGD